MSTRRAVDFQPVSPQKEAGIRQEPPVSVPSPTALIPVATDTAAPEEEPPGIRAGSTGFCGVP